MARTKASPSGTRLNKAAFVRRHAERHSLVWVTAKGRRIPRIKDANNEVIRVLDSIVHETVVGNSIVITGFGTIQAVKRPAHNARNPQTGEAVWVPEQKDVKFIPGENYRMLLNKRRRLPGEGINAVRKASKGAAVSAATLRRRASRQAAAGK